MHNHQHDHCLHEHLKYCDQCDVVYCVNCGQEWGHYRWYPIVTHTIYPDNSPIWTVNPITTGTTTVKDTSTGTQANICSHHT